MSEQERKRREEMARMKRFIANRQKFPPEELARYAGRWIAWHPEGTAIVASSADSEQTLSDAVRAQGYDLSVCCIDYISETEGLPEEPPLQNRPAPVPDRGTS